jgi:Acyltransferase family
MNSVAFSSEKHAPVLQPAKKQGETYNLALGYLRAFLVVLVLAHHAVLAYHPFAPPAPATLTAQPRWWQAFPVVDSQRWTGFSVLVGFNDVFFMSLLFFLSGLFVLGSLQRKGTGTFLRDRLLKLGLPFIVATAVVAPLAYFPTYLQTGAHGGLSGFWTQWFALGNWPSGPAWFIWLLLVFDCLAAALFVLWPRWAESIGGFISVISRRPITFFSLLIALSASAYIPMALAFNPLRWTAFGPFAFQTSRILHYLLYFLIAVVIGAYGIERGLLAPEGKLARRWPLWVLRALFAFGLASAVTIAAFSHPTSAIWGAAADFTFVLSRFWQSFCVSQGRTCRCLIAFARTPMGCT